MAFMDLEKVYEKIDRNAGWQVLRTYGVRCSLLKVVKCFYCRGRACIRGESDVSVLFDVNSGLRL